MFSLRLCEGTGLCSSFPLPKGSDELKYRILAALETINQDMLQHVWQEVNYQDDMCSFTGIFMPLNFSFKF